MERVMCEGNVILATRGIESCPMATALNKGDLSDLKSHESASFVAAAAFVKKCLETGADCVLTTDCPVCGGSSIVIPETQLAMQNDRL